MSLFSSIMEKLGFGSKTPPTDSPAPASPASAASPASLNAPAAGPSAASSASTVPPPAAPVAISQVDVVARLEAMAAANAQKLNWRVSIVDLLKLLDLDSSLDSRKSLAAELGCPQDKMSDSAQMNIWLHKSVLQRLADNGGNIPKELL